MEDQTDLLAQLTRLHAQGLLTDVEYQEKKTALHSRSLNSPEAFGDAQQDASSGRPSNKTRYAYAAILGIAMLGFVGLLATQASKSGRGNAAVSTNEGSDTQAAGLPESPVGDGWTATTERDPMTDVTYGQAIARIAGQQSDAEIFVRCGSDGVLSYTISTFDKDGNPAPMRMTEVAPLAIGPPAGSSQTYQPRVSPGYVAINYEIRSDSEKSIPLSFDRPQFNNQVKIAAPLGTPTAQLLFQLAGHDTVTVRLPMPYGEETYQWYQAVEPFKKTATSCLLAQQKVQAESEARAKAAAEPPPNLSFPQ